MQRVCRLLLALPFAAIPTLTVTAQDVPAERIEAVRVVALKHAVAADLAQVLRELIGADDVQQVVVPHAESDSLLIEATPARSSQIQQLISRLDVPVGQQDPEGARTEVQGDYVTLAFSDDGLPAVEFIKLAQLITGKVYSFDAASIGAKKIELIGTVKVEKARFESLFQTLLYVHGMALERRGEGGTTITAVVLATDEGTRRTRFVPIDAIDDHPDTGRDILTILELKHTEARQAVSDYRPFGNDDTRLGVIGTGNGVLLQGPPRGVREAVAVLRLADRAAEVRTSTRVVILEHSDAERMAATLSQLLGNQMIQGAHAGAAQWIPAPFRAVATGSRALVLTGRDETVATAMDVITQLDTPAVWR